MGDAEPALDWATFHKACIVNGANIDCPWAPECHRHWLKLNFRGDLNGRKWEQAVRSCLASRLEALKRGTIVFLHCLSGNTAAEQLA